MRGAVAVTVLTPVYGEKGPLGNRQVTWESEEVPGVLPAPSDGSDMPADRPEGTRASVTFHFPKSFVRDTLRGCVVVWGGRRFRVVGDPMPYPETLVPGPWSWPVETEETHG